jgi:Rieske Fe-S protein
VSEISEQGAGSVTRRAVIGGVGAIGVAIGLAACGSGNGDAQANGSRLPDGSATTPGTSEATPAEIKTGDIPVGGGKIYAADDTVVTQPKKGEFKAFSATCTHQGCTVASISNGTINCPCHGSRYSIDDGAVIRAATGLTTATQDPLPAKAVTVKNGVIEVT